MNDATHTYPRKMIFLAALFAIGLGVAAAFYFRPGAPAKPPSGAVAELSEADFDAKTANGLHLVDFWAAWCGPCRLQGPIVEKLATGFAGRVAVSKIDVDANGKLADRFDIRSIPTLVIIKDGREIRRLSGLQSEEELSKILTGIL